MLKELKNSLEEMHETLNKIIEKAEHDREVIQKLADDCKEALSRAELSIQTGKIKSH